MFHPTTCNWNAYFDCMATYSACQIDTCSYDCIYHCRAVSGCSCPCPC